MKATDRLLKKIESPLGAFSYYSLAGLEKEGIDIRKYPFSIRILLENCLRNFNGTSFTKDHLDTLQQRNGASHQKEIPFLPARVLMQDFTGVPAVVDIASLRSEMARRKLDPKLINPQVPVDLIIDHSVQVDFFGSSFAFERNVALEYERNGERYSLLKWAQSTFENFSVLPPGLGICHQVNLEYLATVVTARNGMLFPDTLVGTDSHTPMVNGIGVLGWGVGGIEAEAVMLGQPIYFMLPEVVGLRLTGSLKEGTSSTDMVLYVAELLRKKGVVGKFVEVFGDGLDNLSVPDRATISNMSPEFGSTVTYFPPDQKTLDYLRITGRDNRHIETVEQYLKTNLLWRENESMVTYDEVIELDLGGIEPSVAGPKRPQDKITLNNLKSTFVEILKNSYEREYTEPAVRVAADTDSKVHDGSLVIAAITSCTNTSNPSVMIGAGLLAKKAVEKGLMTKPWVKTSLAPGSKVVTDYLEKAKLVPYLEALGFYTVGYGCTTCIGNSGPLPEPVSKAVTENKLVVSAILSGNRNFEARIHPLVKMNFLASPLLVVAFAIPGRIDIDIQNEPLGFDPNQEPVYLRDIWPSAGEIQSVMDRVLDSTDFISNYENIFQGDEKWEQLDAPAGNTYEWNEKSSYLHEAPFFKDLSPEIPGIIDIHAARVLLMLGDSITTDHISPAGSIAEESPAGIYLRAQGVEKKDFNSYGSRRGNHEVMVRGTFANVRLKNQLVDREGGWTRYHPDGTEMTVFDASEKYRENEIPLIILAGKEYGSGSSRDWAAKGASLLGVRAVLAESFERIHRSNLVGMGILPLQLMPGENVQTLNLDGGESFDILNLENITPNAELRVIVHRKSGTDSEFTAIARLDSSVEMDYYRNGGILQFVLRNFIRNNKVTR